MKYWQIKILVQYFFTQNSHYLVVQKLLFHFHLVQHEDPTRNKSVLKQQYHTTYTTEKV